MAPRPAFEGREREARQTPRSHPVFSTRRRRLQRTKTGEPGFGALGRHPLLGPDRMKFDPSWVRSVIKIPIPA